MKTTERFKEAIKKYLDDRAEIDEEFDKAYKKENKNMDDCIKYILNTVKKSDVNGFEDEEIYSMAIHYYDEDNIDIGKDIDMKVVINHKVQLTDEEKKEAKEKAIREIIDENKRSMRKAGKKEDKKYKTVEKEITTDKGNKYTITEKVEEKPKFTEQTLF